MHARHAHAHRHIKHGQLGWVPISVDEVPHYVQAALRQAMQKEGVSPADFDDLLWIMAQESSGRVGVSNDSSSARGLFQLLRAQYDLYPSGERSLGNAVEECQGGIRYIYGRYHTARAAREFWEQHHWY
jgi:hypothetical protein